MKAENFNRAKTLVADLEVLRSNITKLDMYTFTTALEVMDKPTTTASNAGANISLKDSYVSHTTQEAIGLLVKMDMLKAIKEKEYELASL